MRLFAFSRCLHALMIFWYYSCYQCFNSHLRVPTQIRSTAPLISSFSGTWRLYSIPRAFSLLVLALVEMRVYWLFPKLSLSLTTGASVFLGCGPLWRAAAGQTPRDLSFLRPSPSISSILAYSSGSRFSQIPDSAYWIFRREVYVPPQFFLA